MFLRLSYPLGLYTKAMLLCPSKHCQHEKQPFTAALKGLQCTKPPVQCCQSGQERAGEGPCGHHAAAHSEVSLGVVQGQRFQRGTSPLAYSSGEPTEKFSACLLLAAPPGHPSATTVSRVPPDWQGAGKPQPFVHSPLPLSKFLRAGKMGGNMVGAPTG